MLSLNVICSPQLGIVALCNWDCCGITWLEILFLVDSLRKKILLLSRWIYSNKMLTCISVQLFLFQVLLLDIKLSSFSYFSELLKGEDWFSFSMFYEKNHIYSLSVDCFCVSDYWILKNCRFANGSLFNFSHWKMHSSWFDWRGVWRYIYFMFLSLR